VTIGSLPPSEPSLRVLWLGDTRDEPPPNGACVWASSALVALSNRTKSLTVCAPTTGPSSILVAGNRVREVSIHVDGDRLAPLELQGYNRALRTLFATHPELLEVDIIYDACGYLYTGHFLAWLRAQRETPIVLHCMIAFAQHCMTADFPEAMRNWLTNSQARAFRTADRLLALSRADYQKIVTGDSSLTSKSSVCPLGTPLQPSAASQWEPFGGTFTITFAGRSNDQSKGFDIFSLAAKEILCSVENCRICVAGARPLELVDSRIQYFGWLPPAAMRDLLRDTHFFVMPSRYEVLGLAALEAMSHGAVVIAAPRGGLLEVIDHGHNGMLISGEVEDWASDIARVVRILAANAGVCKQISQNACFSATTKWSLGRSVEGVFAAWIDAARQAST
jgi:glycosyltransferase involved in cell wall biosynthesis